MSAFNLQNLRLKIAQPGFRRYFKNTGWMFLGQFFSLGIAFFISAYVARYLGPNNFGLMNYALSFAGLFGFLAGFGIDSILTRELVKFPDQKAELLGTSFWLKFGGGILAIIVLNTVSFFTNADYLSRLLIFIFSLTFIGQSFNVISLYFQAQVIAKKMVIAQIITNILSALLKLIFIYYNLGVIWLTAIYVFDSFSLAVGLLFIYYKNNQTTLDFKINPTILKALLKDSFPLMLAIIMTTIYAKIGQVILKHLLDATAVGLYSAAVKLSEVWYFIPGVICGSLFPAIINAKQSDLNSYKKRLRNLYLLMIGLAALIAVPLFISAPLIVKLLFGSSYAGAIGVWRIYIWSGLPVFFMTALGQYLLAENYTKIYFLITLIGAIANIILNFILIPNYGVEGSALATLISYSLVPLSLIFFRQTREQLILIFK